MHQQMWVIDENNWHVGENNTIIIGEIFKPELQNRIIDKIKSILGSSLEVSRDGRAKKYTNKSSRDNNR